jgi:phosphoglycolate phosphatase (TIGR01487 family)
MSDHRDRPARPVRAIVTDVDGTLTDRSRRLDARALGAARSVADPGLPFVIATGNVLPIALALHRFLGLQSPIVAENGGILYRRVGDREVVEHLAHRAVALRAYRELKRQQLPVRRLFTDRWRESEVALEPTVPEARVRRAVRRHPVLVEGTGYATHIMERGAGKLPALRRALGQMHLRLSDCMVLGDGDNDVGMLRAAGWAVTFPSGSARARRAADYITQAPYSDGFVEAIMRAGVLPTSSSG